MQAGTVPRHHRSPGRSRGIPLPPVAIVGSVALMALLALTFRSSLPFLSDPSAPYGATLPGAFLYQQQRGLSCEYASVYIATTMTGQAVSEYAFDDVVPLNENPHLGYRGNIHGEWGNTTDYGVYNGPLELALTQFGVRSDAFYAAGDRTALTDELDLGRPVVVWLALWGADGSFDAYSADGTRYQLTRGMHVKTAYGYDETGVYLTDPGTAVYQFYDWQEFMWMWDIMDGMGLSVYP